MRLIGVVTLVTVIGVAFCPIMAARCSDVLVAERADYDPDSVSAAIHARKVQFALAVISDRTYSLENPMCVSSALFFLVREISRHSGNAPHD
jgi:hypothetical protein